MRFPIANPELRSTGSVNGMLPTHADALGRTQVIGTSSIQAPALKQFVSVTDAPWGAKGDAKRVTDGAITTGTALLSSASAAFTTKDVGKRCDIVGAGAAGVRFTTSILSVAAGVATVAANASTTVSSAVVTYGTDDTTSIQGAKNALSAAGGGRLLIPATRGDGSTAQYMITSIVMTSNVVVDARGAIFLPLFTSNNCGFRSLTVNGNAPVTNWTIFGATFQNDNADYPTGGMVNIWVDTAGSSDIRVEDCTFRDNADCAIDLFVPRFWIVNNRFDHVCFHTGGRNVINCQWNQNGVATDATVHGNFLTNMQSMGIHVGSEGSSSLTVQDMRVTITANKVQGTCNTGIATEVGGGGMQSIVVANNIISIAGPGGAGVNGTCVALGGGNGTTAGENNSIVVQGNVCSSTTLDGISINCDYCACIGNVVNVLRHGITTARTGATMSVTTDGTTAVLTAVVFPGGSSQQPQLETLISGAGIPNGSYITAINVGANTVTINQATTAAATITATFVSAMRGVVVAHNSIHMPTSATGNGLQTFALAYSSVADNLVYAEPGNSSATTYCWTATNCYFTSFENNRFENSPRYGFLIQQSHDCDVIGNKIHNPNQNGAASNAANGNNVWNMNFERNKFVDDTAASKITTMMTVSGTSGNNRARYNTVIGETSAQPISLANFTDVRGNYVPNTAHSNPFPPSAVALGASPATYTNADAYPETVIFSGGTVSAIAVAKVGNATFYPTGLTAGQFYLDVGDSIKVTYTVIPTQSEKLPLS